MLAVIPTLHPFLPFPYPLRKPNFTTQTTSLEPVENARQTSHSAKAVAVLVPFHMQVLWCDTSLSREWLHGNKTKPPLPTAPTPIPITLLHNLAGHHTTAILNTPRYCGSSVKPARRKIRCTRPRGLRGRGSLECSGRLPENPPPSFYMINQTMG